MTRSTTNPLRRMAAAAAIVGVTGFGAVALASPALAAPALAAPAPAPVDETTPAVTATVDAPTPAVPAVDAPAAPGHIQSPVPDKAIDVTIGPVKLKLTGQAAQLYQTVEANLYAWQGYQVTFDKHGVLIIGKKICDPTRSAEWNRGCVKNDGPRF